MRPENMQPPLEGLRMHHACPLKILRLQVLYLFVGHELPSYDLLLPPSPDFCKRSIVFIRHCILSCIRIQRRWYNIRVQERAACGASPAAEGQDISCERADP